MPEDVVVNFAVNDFTGDSISIHGKYLVTVLQTSPFSTLSSTCSNRTKDNAECF
jgi:hypothetical protein